MTNQELADAGPEDEEYITPADVLDRLDAVEGAMRADFEQLATDLRKDLERVAAAVTPLLARQHAEAQARMRVLETRLRNRQERPLIVLLANLLTDVRRLRSAADVKEHVEQTLSDALVKAGYQEMGSPGDQFDPDWHEPVSGSASRSGVVTHVYTRGLACFGDVIIKAKVDVGPAVHTEAEPVEQGEPLT